MVAKWGRFLFFFLNVSAAWSLKCFRREKTKTKAKLTVPKDGT